MRKKTLQKHLIHGASHLISCEPVHGHCQFAWIAYAHIPKRIQVALPLQVAVMQAGTQATANGGGTGSPSHYTMASAQAMQHALPWGPQPGMQHAGMMHTGHQANMPGMLPMQQMPGPQMQMQPPQQQQQGITQQQAMQHQHQQQAMHQHSMQQQQQHAMQQQQQQGMQAPPPPSIGMYEAALLAAGLNQWHATSSVAPLNLSILQQALSGLMLPPMPQQQIMQQARAALALVAQVQALAQAQGVQDPGQPGAALPLLLAAQQQVQASAAQYENIKQVRLLALQLERYMYNVPPLKNNSVQCSLRLFRLGNPLDVC